MIPGFDGVPEAGALAARLADSLVRQGDIVDSRWRDVFAGIPRHVCVPHFAETEDTPRGTRYVRLDATLDRTRWLETVYSDRTLITEIDGQPVERALAAGAGYGRATSSSTAPGLMAWMLNELRIDDGMRVLELGTGSGYNAALLCARLGSDHVTSIDIDATLVTRARQHLSYLGYHPTLACLDGRAGYADGAPYDRVIATCSLPAVPPSWVAQTRPGGLIFTNVTGLLGGAMLLARVDSPGSARGRFVSRWAGFMCARPSAPGVAEITALDTDEGAFDVDVTELSPDLLTNPAFAFVAQLHVVDALPYWATHEDGRELFGLIAPDGSWAEIYPSDDTGRRPVEQGGPRRLWTRVEDAHRFWEAHDRPDWSRFGVTIVDGGQYAWFDNPEGTSWELPA